ncbi:hypothetical protein [Pseudomonas sp. NA-150]|uniref:hypothetical protein n=1 Tax=Pseudomonas sp. NA-150 TaxID=3367525 RepID=UPI0037C8130F
MNLRALIVAVMLVLAGCATPHPVVEQPPAVVVPGDTWRKVDRDIISASQDASVRVRQYAHDSMESWRNLVRQRTESDFIPWFSSYWTEQWLTMKVTWYKVSNGQAGETPEQRLSIYLQEQYHDRVLTPVASQVDPDLITSRAITFYIQALGMQLQSIPQRYGIPTDQFDRRLNEVPAITLAPPATRSASLYDMIHTDPATLPAYAALVEHIRQASTDVKGRPSDSDISTAAIRSSKKLEAQLAPRGVASAVAAAVGRAAGVMISVGMAGFGAIAHERDRPEMEALLRQNLQGALDAEWRALMENPNTGVLAGVNHLSGNIEGELGKTAALPDEFQPGTPQTPQTDDQAAER